jgi:Sugar (pentulose and hexulose) kinases
MKGGIGVIVIGLDIGTTSICGAALELPGGRLLRSVTRPNNAWLQADGVRAEQDPERIMTVVREILQELTAQYPDAAGIGIAGQMHGILYVDRSGKAVSPLYTWQDRRGLEPADDRGTYVEWLARETGRPLAAGFGLVTHAVLARQGNVPDQAAALCTIADYAAMRLGGGSVPVMDPSMAASIGFYDVEHGRFDTQALNAVGLGEQMLPRAVSSATRVGATDRGIPVFHAIGDNQASFLGSVRDPEQSVLINIGTGGQMTAYTGRYCAAQGLDTRPFPGGGYLIVGASLSGGKSYAMLETFFRSVLEWFGDVKDVPPLYGKMEELLDRFLPMKSPLRVSTRFYGTRTEPELTGSIGGIGPDNFTPAHLAAGFLEGMAEELFDFYKRLPDAMRGRMRRLVGSGNAIRHNRHLRRICEERFGLPLSIPRIAEEASVGAALHAAVGLGVVKDHRSAGQCLAYDYGENAPAKSETDHGY